MNSSKSVKSIYDQHKEARQNDRLAQDLSSHNWLVNKITTIQLEPDLNKRSKKEENIMQRAKNITKGIKTKRSLSPDTDTSTLHKRGCRSMPDLGDKKKTISVLKVSEAKHNKVASSFPVLKKILNNEDLNSKPASSKNSSSGKNKTPVDERQEGGTSATQSFEKPVAGNSSKTTGILGYGFSEKLPNQDTPKLIKHNLPVPALPVRRSYQQRSAKPAISATTQDPENFETQNLVDPTLTMDHKGLIECLKAHNINTVGQLMKIIKVQQISDEERKILEFLKSKVIFTLDNLIENLRGDDDIVFVNEEAVPDGEKVVPVSKKKVKALLEQSDKNKMVLSMITTSEWCRTLLLHAVNNASKLANQTDESSCSTQSVKPNTGSQEPQKAISIVDQGRPKIRESHKKDQSFPETASPIQKEDAQCAQTLESEFASGPQPRTSTQPDAATVIASHSPPHAVPQTARTASYRGRKRSYASRDPRYRGNQANPQAGASKSQQEFLLHNMALQPPTSLPSTSKELPNKTGMLPQNFQDIWQSTQHAAHFPPQIGTQHSQYAQHAKNAQLAQLAQNAQNTQNAQNAQNAQHLQHVQRTQPAQHAQNAQLAQHAQHAQFAQHAQQAQHVQHTQLTNTSSRTTRPPPHRYPDVPTSRGPSDCVYAPNFPNQSHTGQTLHPTNNPLGLRLTNGGQSNLSYPYKQWVPEQAFSGQHWQEPMTTLHPHNINNQIFTCSTFTITNTTLSNHTIVNPTMSDTNFSAAQLQQRTSMHTASTLQWSPPTSGSVGGEHWPTQANASNQYRASVVHTRGPHRNANIFAGNKEGQFPNDLIGGRSPPAGSPMPEWLWHCRHWPHI